MTDFHELWADLERVRREIATGRHELEVLVNPDHVPAHRARLEQAVAEEQDLLAQLAQLDQPAAATTARRRSKP